MIIIWGTRAMRKIVAHNGPFTCTGCFGVSQFPVVRTATWFTLFWIPIFPFSFQYNQVCPHCGQQYPIEKQQAKELAQAAKAQKQLNM